MQRTEIDPWGWAAPLGYAQAVAMGGTVHVAGQTAVDEAGAPQHPDDMRAQMALVLDNLDAVLAAAGAGWGDVVRLGVHATDVDAAFGAWDLLGARLGGAKPAITLLGVARLARPELSIEIEATAMLR